MQVRTDCVRVIKTPPQAPRANAICERVVGTLRRELLDRTLILGERHLRAVLYAAHYNRHRPPRSPDLRAPADGADLIRLPVTRIERRQALPCLINEYERVG
jgi:hypothetical protein